MNDDFVPFELAVKLKENGFPQHCSDNSYVTENEYDDYFEVGERYLTFAIYDYVSTIDAPTISQVLKWLREEKKIHIIIEIADSGWYYTIYPNIRWENGKLKSDNYIMSSKNEESYEQAILTGIEYVIDNFDLTLWI